MNNKPFYLKPQFYLVAVCFVLTFVATVLYAANCPSEFNGEKVSSGVVAADVLTLIWCLISLAGMIVPEYVKNELVVKICSFARYFEYLAFFALLGAIFAQVLAEYSLIGTILYPLVSGTTGDPVDPTLSTSFFVSLIAMLIAAITVIVAGGMERRAAFRAEKLAANA